MSEQEKNIKIDLSELKKKIFEIIYVDKNNQNIESLLKTIFSDLEYQIVDYNEKISFLNYHKSKLENLYNKINSKYKENLNFTSQLFNKLDIAIRVINKDFKIILANQAYSELINQDLSKILNSYCGDFICANKCNTDECSIKKAINNYSFSEKDINFNINGFEKFYILSIAPYFNKNNEIEGIIEAYHDITKKKKSEIDLYNSKIDLKKILENSVEGIAVIQDGKFVFFNPKMLELTGYSSDELKIINFWEIIHPDYRNEIIGNHQKRLKGEKLQKTYSFKFFKKNNELKWGELNAVSITWNNRNAVLLFVIDITIRKENENEVNNYINKLSNLNEELEFQKKALSEYNEEILAFLDERSKKQEIIEEKNRLLSEAYQNITDSLIYASKIQYALLPPEQLIDSMFENFILYIPRHIVSGDFYFVKKVNDYIIFAVADCTGHGVPGSFLTTLFINFLNDIIEKNEINETSQALEKLRDKVKIVFKESGKQDGMDIAICAYNQKTFVLQYSGAFIPLYLIRNKILIEHKPTRNPIGFYEVEDRFSTSYINIEKNDLIYLSTDGFADQFGNANMNYKKFQKSSFKDLLLNISIFTFAEQKNKLINHFNKWKGFTEQTDDVLVMGAKLRK